MFWTAYPRKAAKIAAQKAYAKLSPSTDLLDEILQAIARQKTGADWTRDGGKYIPYPASWLNDGRWADEAMPEAQQRRPAVVQEPQWRVDQKTRSAEFLGPYARKSTNTVEAEDAAAKLLGR